MTEVQDAQKLIRKTLRFARKSRGPAAGWGCTLEPIDLDGEGRAWQMTTIGGERIILLNEMVHAAKGHVFILQGRTTCMLRDLDNRPGFEPAREIGLQLYHAPSHDPAAREMGLMTSSLISAHGKASIVLLSKTRPAAWPL